MPNCEICSADRPQQDMLDSTICKACAQQLGLPAATPALRPMLPCSRCNHTILVRSALRERDGRIGYVSPAAVTFQATTRQTFWTGNDSADVNPDRPIGILEAYVCRRCGYTELYTRDAALIPIGREHGTELIEVGSDSPYR